MLAYSIPKGFNTWNHFGCGPPVGSGTGPSDALMRQQADTMVSSGMAKAGYVHVNIDGTRNYNIVTYEGVYHQ